MKERYYSESLLRSLAYEDDVNGDCDGKIDFTVIDSLSGEDVAPIIHGEWREEFRSQISSDGYFYWNTPQKKIYVCSICGREEVKKEPYCNCGARMDGGNE